MATLATVGAVSTVTLFVDAADRLPAASSVYALYVPSSKPVAARLVDMPATSIATWFHKLSAAVVMLAWVVTVRLVLTR